MSDELRSRGRFGVKLKRACSGVRAEGTARLGIASWWQQRSAFDKEDEVGTSFGMLASRFARCLGSRLGSQAGCTLEGSLRVGEREGGRRETLFYGYRGEERGVAGSGDDVDGRADRRIVERVMDRACVGLDRGRAQHQDPAKTHVCAGAIEPECSRISTCLAVLLPGFFVGRAPLLPLRRMRRRSFGPYFSAFSLFILSLIHI
eukprot:6197940-Pleurochrysis_carterae.AAC.2